MAMNPELKAKWIATLRGEGDYLYAQGLGRLCKVVDGEHRYCCLGVLADIAVESGLLQVDVERNGYEGRYENYSWDGSPTQLTERVRKAVGISSLACDTAAMRNDGGWTFAQIADWLEGLQSL